MAQQDTATRLPRPSMLPAEPVLVVDNLAKQFDTPDGPLKAVDDVSFAVRRGEFLSVIGPSGCGKSTVFNIVGGLTPASAGRIVVMYVEWAGSSQQQIVIPWTVIEHPTDGLEFAARLAGSSMHHGRHTSISAVIDFGVRQLREGAVRATRQTIDISGDGANNQGRMVTLARDAALAHDVTINGLPIMLKRPAGTWETAELDLYFRDCVIGGPGAFLIPVREQGQFAEAIRLKIVREIADRPQARALVQPAGGEQPRCFHDPCSEEGSVC